MSGLAAHLDSWRLAGLTAWGPRAACEVCGLPREETQLVEPAESVAPEPIVLEPAAPTVLPNTLPKNLEELATEVALCQRCPKLAASRTQTVFGSGNPHAELVFIGEAPGADEDRTGFPFVGRAGQLLTDMITKGMGLSRDDVYICNVLRCRPPGNRTPLPEEAEQCRPFLDATLEIISPRFLCCLGAVAAQNLLSTTVSIGSLRGRLHDYRGITVVCTYHPAYLLRNPAAKGDTWNDIQLLMKAMELPIPVK